MNDGASAGPVSLTTRPYRDYLGNDVLELIVTNLAGHYLGGKIEGDRLMVQYIQTPPEGVDAETLGLAVVQRAVEHAADNGLRFSFNCCTADIKPILSRMRRSGYALRVNRNWSLWAPADVPAVEIDTTRMPAGGPVTGETGPLEPPRGILMQISKVVPSTGSECSSPVAGLSARLALNR